MTCARASFLIKLQASGLLKKRLRYRCFPVNFTKFFKIPILQSTFEQLLLSILDQCCTNRLICSACVNLIYFTWVNFQHVWEIMWETNKKATKTHKYDQKQPPEVFFKKRCSWNFCKIQACAKPATLLKKGPWHRCFPVNFTKFLRTPFLQNTSGRLLLYDLHSEIWINFECAEEIYIVI